MNFKNGTALAVQQDGYLKRYLNGGKFSKKEISEMKDNYWVKTASILAPSNLVVRQYALIDIMNRYPTYTEPILKQLKTLTYNTKDNLKLWAEGYSYFCYTRDILDEWCKLFSKNAYDINKLIEQVDDGFLETSYVRKGLLYPALFGDLRDEPLRPHLQNRIRRSDIPNPIEIVNVFKGHETVLDSVVYIVEGKPIGLNSHIPKDDSISFVIKDEVVNFKFYEGYDKKYKNKMEEIGDSVNIIKSILLNKFKKN